MFSNNLVSLIANTILYLGTVAISGDDTLMRVFNDKKLLTDVIMIGTSGAIG